MSHMPSAVSEGRARPNILHAGIALALVATAGFLGWLATEPNLAWHAGLRKPWFNPPNAVFGPVWTVLYLLMAFAFWRVLNLSPSTSGRSTAIRLFLAQLALNALWSFLFFGAHSPLAGLLDIVPQLALIVVTMLAFWRLDAPAGLALLPLAFWVGFATILNFAIWRLN